MTSEQEERKKYLMARLDGAAKQLNAGGAKAEGAYREIYQRMVQEGLAPQLRKKYR